MGKEPSLRRTQTRNHPGVGEEAFARIAESEDEIATLRTQLKEITAGPAFKGSHRSGQFLEFVIEQSIAGNFEELKERLIGVHLFKREPSYDTGEDAIVRVTASDVRKRLLQHYGWFGTDCEYRIDLPLGSYIPHISRKIRLEESHSIEPGSAQKLDAAGPNLDLLAPKTSEPEISPPTDSKKFQFALEFLRYAAIVCLALAFGWWLRSSRITVASSANSSSFPWSALFSPTATAHLITSDPIIDTVEGLTRTSLSLSDYANHRYMPEPNTLTPEMVQFCKGLLATDSSAATPDAPITAKVAQIAQTFSKKLLIQSSRNFQLSFLSSSDNFIFLGSPRSNPWFSLFTRALNFQFVYDPKMGSEFIRNLHPQHNEQATYLPSAIGGGTGYSFAIVAFVQNPDQNGEVLLLAGANGEATAAAGDFVTDVPRLSHALESCGIQPSGPVRHFEMLLRTETMAGVPRGTGVVACHTLPGTSSVPPANQTNN